MHRTMIPGHFAEETKCEINATLKDETGAVVGSGRLTECTLTLYDKSTDTILNSQDAADILSSIDVNGVLSLALLPDDMAMKTATKKEEKHVALIHYEWDADGEANQEVEFRVRNMNRVPVT